MKHSLLAASLVAAFGLAALSAPAFGQTLTKQLVVSGLGNPIYVTSPPGDTSRLFVVQQNGTINIVKNGTLLATPFLNVGAGGLGLISTGSERGLLGLAFHPNYASNGFFYINYTDNTGGDTVIRRYTVSANPDLADTGSAFDIVNEINQPQSNHNGGCIQFGPDGKLYVGMGDGGNFNDTGTGHVAGGNSQSGTQLLGKILRYDVDIAAPFIPADNPFVGNPSVLDEIWHLGVRNPWRFSFDRLTGDMYIGDVGQDAREEISFQPAGVGGLNYGWRCMEGFNCTGLSGCTCNAPSLTLPIHEYNHSPGCVSVTGGYVYRGCEISGFDGTYIFADYCKRQVWTFDYDGVSVSNFQERTAEVVNTGGPLSTISSFGEDALGELYITDSSGGRVYKLVEAGVTATDCNLNGIADACDIANGISQDTNTNGIPDECECAPAPFTYCTAKLTSNFCLPVASFQGTPKTGNPFPFLVEAGQIPNGNNGILFYGKSGSATSPFQGGTLCAAAPVTRTGVQGSGGNPGTSTDCSGDFSFDFNAYIGAGTDPGLVAGQQVNAQYWFRDTGDAFGSGLSDAVEFVICN